MPQSIKAIVLDTERITQDQLKQYFNYDPLSGLFTARIETRGIRTGDTVGYLREGYLIISFKGYPYKAHQLAFLYMTGSIPKMIDHKDTVRSNNSWSNLRECTPGENMQNMKLSSRNSSGIKGVNWDKKLNKWKTQVCLKGKLYFGGYFQEIADAKIAVESLRNSLHTGFRNHG